MNKGIKLADSLAALNPFPLVFYCSAALASLGAMLAVCLERGTYKHAAAAALALPLLVTYLIGMYRVDGVDFVNYQAYLGSERDRIPDIGYRLLMDCASALGLTVSEFFLLQAMFTLVAIYLLAKKLNSDIVIVITLVRSSRCNRARFLAESHRPRAGSLFRRTRAKTQGRVFRPRCRVGFHPSVCGAVDRGLPLGTVYRPKTARP